jgi:hypothetical protein
MVNLDLNEYTVIDNILTDLKLTPDKIELPIPAYYAKVNYTVMVMVAHWRLGRTARLADPGLILSYSSWKKGEETGRLHRKSTKDSYKNLCWRAGHLSSQATDQTLSWAEC